MASAIHIAASFADEVIVENGRAGEYLSFRIARQDFVMRASRVQALLPVHEMIPLEAPVSWIIGVIAVGGIDCPVIDLRAKLAIAHGSEGRQPCVVVVGIFTAEGPQRFGFVADRITEIIKLRERNFRETSARVNGRIRRIFDPDALSADSELWRSWHAAAQPGPGAILHPTR